MKIVQVTFAARLCLAVALAIGFAFTGMPCGAQQSSADAAPISNPNPPVGWEPVVSPDGLLKADIPAELPFALYVTNLKTGTKTLVIKDPAGLGGGSWNVAGGLSFSPDDSQVVFAAGPARQFVSTVYLANVDGSGWKALARSEIHVADSIEPWGKAFYDTELGRPSFSPDGKKVLISMRVTNDARDENARVDDEASKDFVALLSPDQDNQAPKNLVEGRPMFWSVDGNSVYYSKRPTDPHKQPFYRFDLATGESTLVGERDTRSGFYSRVPGMDALFVENAKRNGVEIQTLDGSTVSSELAAQATAIPLKDASGQSIRSIESAGPHQVYVVYRGNLGEPAADRQLIKFE